MCGLANPGHHGDGDVIKGVSKRVCFMLCAHCIDIVTTCCSLTGNGVKFHCSYHFRLLFRFEFGGPYFILIALNFVMD